MALINWSEEFSVGVKDFDSQHQKLIDIANELHTAMREGKGKKVIEETVKELDDYTKYHFGLEEKNLELIDYPDIKEQKEQHKYFLQKIADLSKRTGTGDFLVSIDTIKFLTDWILNHINKIDKKYTSFFSGKTIQS